MKRVKYRDLEDIVLREQLTYDEIVVLLGVKYITRSTKGYTLTPGIFEVVDIKMMLKFPLPRGVKVNITGDNIRLKSNLTNNKTNRFTKKIFFLHNIGFYLISFRCIR